MQTKGAKGAWLCRDELAGLGKEGTLVLKIKEFPQLCRGDPELSHGTPGPGPDCHTLVLEAVGHTVELSDGDTDSGSQVLLALLVQLGPKEAQVVVGHHLFEQLLGTTHLALSHPGAQHPVIPLPSSRDGPWSQVESGSRRSRTHTHRSIYQILRNNLNPVQGNQIFNMIPLRNQFFRLYHIWPGFMATEDGYDL